MRAARNAGTHRRYHGLASANRTPQLGIESEWLTRKRRIDPLLDAAGWPLRRGRRDTAFRTEEGETVTISNQIYGLMKAGLARRVLFLVDRRALAAEAVRAFNSFDAEPLTPRSPPPSPRPPGRAGSRGA